MKFNELPTPCYVIDRARLIKNLEILKSVKDAAGAKILLAQKAFSAFALYPLLEDYLDGFAASGLFEARLAKEEGFGENHVFSAAYREDEFDEILKYSDHVVFNSLSQYERFAKKAQNAGAAVGLRINPECSTQDGHAIYDPCAPGSRLGITAAGLKDLPEGISGLHFHTLCEQNADALKTTLEAVESRFSHLFDKISWINFGGGHHITRDDYDVELLCRLITHFREKYGLRVYLEPGEAIALNAGYLVCRVLDLTENGIKNAILDTSAACHMPDVLEMPYRPPLKDAGEPNEKPYTYRLGGPTCLAGDVIGDYSFDKPLSVGDRLVFEDMAIYSMVKNNTFNGMPLPHIAIADDDGVHIRKSFSYADFKCRLS
jgi:carboxynorspermidine decarboxylase